MRVGYYQFRPLFGRVEKNLIKVVKSLSEAEADLIVLPELPFTGYYFQNRDELKALAEEPAKSPTVDSLIELCKARNFHIVTGFAEKAADRYFNSALLIGPKGVRHTYRKIHLFNEEKNWFDPGDTPLAVQKVQGAKIGIMVCFDWIFPEVTRALSVMGADIICHPSNLVLSFCQDTMLSRCLENAVYAITANRFGSDNRPQGSLRFTGKSQVVAPKGRLINRSASQRNDLFICDIDPTLARNKQITDLNDIMTDRRPDFYRPLTNA